MIIWQATPITYSDDSGTSNPVFIKDIEIQGRCCCCGCATTRMTTTKTPQICIFDNEKQYFCTVCTCIFHLLTFWRRSRSFYDVKWPVLQLCGMWWQMFNFVCLCPKRWFQFNSRIPYFIGYKPSPAISRGPKLRMTLFLARWFWRRNEKHPAISRDPFLAVSDLIKVACNHYYTKRSVFIKVTGSWNDKKNVMNI